MKYRSFLIKYAEIGVKGKNRYLFEDALVKQIHHRLKNLEGNFSVTKEAGRIYAEAAEDFDYDEVIDALQHVLINKIQTIDEIQSTETLIVLQNPIMRTIKP